MIPLKFSVLLVDPPWHFKTRGKTVGGRTPQEHYDSLTIEQLIELGLLIDPLMKKDSVLFLWIPYRSTPGGLAVMETWGFEFRTLAWVWVKRSMSDFSKIAMGLGYYTRNCSEACWIGVRGNMPVKDKSVPQYMESHRLDYSQKPTLQYDFIERLYPSSLYPNKLELFATNNGIGSRNRYGWKATGLALDGKDVFESLEALAQKT